MVLFTFEVTVKWSFMTVNPDFNSLVQGKPEASPNDTIFIKLLVNELVRFVVDNFVRTMTTFDNIHRIV